MSKKAAIHYALLAELAAQQKPAANQTPALAGSLSTALAFAANAIDADKSAAVRRLLSNVAIRLRSDAPPLDFAWSTLGDNVLNDSLQLLIERIAECTTDPAAKAESAAKAG